MSIVIVVLAAGFFALAGIMQWPWLALASLGLAICALTIGPTRTRPATAISWIRKNDQTMPPARDALPIPLLATDWIRLNHKTADARNQVIPFSAKSYQSRE